MVVLLAACTAPIEVEARFETTRATCGLEPVPLDAEAYLHAPAMPPSCRAAVLADLRADEASLTDAGTLDTLLAAAGALMTVDLGSVRSLPEGPLARELRQTAAVTGGDEIAGLLYDYAAARFTAVLGETDEAAHAAVDTSSGVVLWAERDAAGIDAAALLVHEARHRDGFDHVPCAPGADVVCDLGGDGAWALQLAVHELAREAATDEIVALSEAAWIETVGRSIR